MARKLKVGGLPEGVTTDRMKFFFNNKKKSGGGKITDIDLNEETGAAVITFANDDVIDDILSRKGSLEVMGKSISVSIYDEEDSISNEVEEPILPVSDGLSGMSRKLKIEGLPQRIESDRLRFFFMNKKKSGGGKIKDLDRNFESGSAIITFEDDEVIDRILKRDDLQIRDHPLAMSVIWIRTDPGSQDTNLGLGEKAEGACKQENQIPEEELPQPTFSLGEKAEGACKQENQIPEEELPQPTFSLGEKAEGACKQENQIPEEELPQPTFNPRQSTGNAIRSSNQCENPGILGEMIEETGRPKLQSSIEIMQTFNTDVTPTVQFCGRFDSFDSEESFIVIPQTVNEVNVGCDQNESACNSSSSEEEQDDYSQLDDPSQCTVKIQVADVTIPKDFYTLYFEDVFSSSLKFDEICMALDGLNSCLYLTFSKREGKICFIL